MIPVILSGGSGTRLWPISRAQFPKQFCHFFDESLMLKTYRRVAPLGEPRFLTIRALQNLTQKSVPAASPNNFIFEPFARNTAPAIALLCHILNLNNLSDQVVGIFPADHWIENDNRFLQVARLAEKLAEQNEIVTLGIQPTYPSTGYGYIAATEKVVLEQGALKALRVQGFHEKPDTLTAKKFLAAGNYFWNAGMFIFKVSRMVQEFKKHQSEMWTLITTIDRDLGNAEAVYEKIHAISIDYAIMEKLTNLVTIPSEMGWNDVGSWEELAKLAEAAAREKPTTIQEHSQGISVFSALNKKYAVIGLEDIIIADTEDALLITRKGESQKVKAVVERLAKTHDPSVQSHKNEIRPWGRFDILADAENFKAKVITVDSKAQISYQSHAKRSEHWIVVSGNGEVVLNDETIAVAPGKYVFIPQGSKHRIRNTGVIPLQFVEVQLGSYFGEDDIVRYHDDYKRL